MSGNIQIRGAKSIKKSTWDIMALVKSLIWAIHHPWSKIHSTFFTKMLESSGAYSLPPFLNSLQDWEETLLSCELMWEKYREGIRIPITCSEWDNHRGKHINHHAQVRKPSSHPRPIAQAQIDPAANRQGIFLWATHTMWLYIVCMVSRQDWIMLDSTPMVCRDALCMLSSCWEPRNLVEHP